MLIRRRTYSPLKKSYVLLSVSGDQTNASDNGKSKPFLLRRILRERFLVLRRVGCRDREAIDQQDATTGCRFQDFLDDTVLWITARDEQISKLALKPADSAICMLMSRTASQVNFARARQ